MRFRLPASMGRVVPAGVAAAITAAAIAVATAIAMAIAIGVAGQGRHLPAGAKRIACHTVSAPESCLPGSGDGPDAADAANFDAELAARLGATPEGYATATAARTRLKHTVPPGGRNRWHPAAAGPLVADSAAFPDSAVSGYGDLSGRVGSFAYDSAHNRLYAAASQGGIWESDDLGQSWRSIGNALPTQITGAVGYTGAGGRQGTVIAATGDNAFGAYTYGGMGMYWSNDDGRAWYRASGIPNGAMSFRVAVDPTRPNVVYVATGLGLYRSEDAGRRFRNVDLPTGRCAGNSLQKDCFLANVVTDVVVQAPDHYGHKGGAVLAAVGWRANAEPNQDGSPQSPANGLYASSTGAPGTFARLYPQGFTSQSRIGRIALGIAQGPNQDHAYVYAEVQDALLFNTGKLEGLDIPSLPDPLGLGIDPTKTDTVLNGVYVSPDFGRTWHEMSDYHLFELPLNGSKLTGDLGYELLGNYGPGIQAWYNEWIAPDPTRTQNGVPTRILTGLEELWQSGSTTTPADGRLEPFRALTPYNGNQSPDCILELLQELVCNLLPQSTVSAVHPDQHGGILIPDGHGGTTVVIGNDGGIYRQHASAGQELTAQGFGRGAQTGLQTLEPYGVAMADDGTIYSGLQDNGNIKISGGHQFETLGGDGVFVATTPTNSKVAYDTLPGGLVFVTTDGGSSWRDASPTAETNSAFYTPLAMDPLDPNHLVTGGREVFDSTSGPNTAISTNGLTIDPGTDWQQVFDLGTRLHPGDPNAAGSEPQDPENQVSAVALRGPDEYVGYCGSCDPVLHHDRFANGIATNVGGKQPPKAGSTAGWHIAKAAGLPERIITSVAIDPANPRHVVVTLGSSTLRPYVPAGALGNDGVSLSAGSVYESFDAGDTFQDVSGNLPRIGAAWAGFHRRQLVVANTVGVFASVNARLSATRHEATRYGVLGRGLPTASVFSFAFAPNDPDRLVAATFGRGVWTYRFGGRR